MSNQIPGMLVSCTKMIYLEQVQMYNHKSVIAYYPLKVWDRKYASVNVQDEEEKTSQLIFSKKLKYAGKREQLLFGNKFFSGVYS